MISGSDMEVNETSKLAHPQFFKFYEDSTIHGELVGPLGEDSLAASSDRELLSFTIETRIPGRRGPSDLTHTRCGLMSLGERLGQFSQKQPQARGRENWGWARTSKTLFHFWMFIRGVQALHARLNFLWNSSTGICTDPDPG
jgi:hypothetical protein